MPAVGLPYRFPGPLRTQRLSVRAMVAGDVDDVHAYQSRDDVCRYLPYAPRTRDEVAEKLAAWGSALTLAGDGDAWQLAIERLGAPGRVIGDVYFSVRSAADAAGEIGCVLDPG